MNDYYVELENAYSTRTGLEFFYQSMHGNDSVVKPHIHTSVEILFITGGCFRVFADNEEYILYPGDAILLRSNTIHKVYTVDNHNAGYYVLKIKPRNILEFSARELGTSYLLRLSLSSKSEKTVWRQIECENNGIKQLLEEIIEGDKVKGYGSDIAFKANSAKMLLLMLRDIEKEHGNTDGAASADANLIRRIYNSIVYINNNYAQELTAEQCGKQQFMSYSYFSRSFKKITGMSFKDYLNMTRINHAEMMLMSGNHTITEISASCGFNNVSYFISIYRKLKGITPAAFRNSLNK